MILAKSSSWFRANLLTINTLKTVFLTFGAYADSVPKNIHITINNYKLCRVTSFKYLGVIIDYNLRWNLHVNQLLKKSRYFLYLFAKLRYLPHNILLVMYYSLYYSVINYGIIVWGGAYDGILRPLQRTQNRINNIVWKNNAAPIGIKNMFVIQSLLQHYETCKEQYINSASITRNKSIILPKINTTITQKSSYYTALKYFNLLPNELKTYTNTSNLKSKLINWIKHK